MIRNTIDKSWVKPVNCREDTVIVWAYIYFMDKITWDEYIEARWIKYNPYLNIWFFYFFISLRLCVSLEVFVLMHLSHLVSFEPCCCLSWDISSYDNRYELTGLRSLKDNVLLFTQRLFALAHEFLVCASLFSSFTNYDGFSVYFHKYEFKYKLFQRNHSPSHSVREWFEGVTSPQAYMHFVGLKT